MLCTTYTNVWSIICPLEVRCLTPLLKMFQLLLLCFIFILHLYITVTCRHTIVFYDKDCFSNIKTSSKRLEYLNILPSFFKKFNTSWNQKNTLFIQYLCFIYFNNLVKYFSGARLRRCLISSKTVQISRAKFHEIQKTNNAHDVTILDIE
jgi:hypothetical protein